MAFPQVAGVNGGNGGVTTSHTVNLPTGINAGDLLLVLFTRQCCHSAYFPTGWVQLFTKADGGYKVQSDAWYKVAEGDEGASITVTTDGVAVNSAHTSYRITGYSGTPEAGTATSGSSTAPNPPSLTPSWGAKDTLWFAMMSHYLTSSVSAYPTNYANGRYDASPQSGVGNARRELNAVSEDPGAFALGTSREWVANTVAIQPVAAGETHYGAATLSGIGTLAGIAHGIFIGKSILSGIGTLAAIGRGVFIGVATFTGTGTLATIGSFLRYAKATLSGAGTLVAKGVGVLIGKSTLSGEGTLAAIVSTPFQTFHPLTPVAVTPGTINSWVDVDVSAYVPAGATGVLLHLVNNWVSSNDMGVRKNGSTDNRHPDLRAYCHCWAAIGVDSNRKFEAYIAAYSPNLQIWLVGYTTSGVTFFTNGYDKSLSAPFFTWTDIDCSTECPNAIGLIFEVLPVAQSGFGLRKNGSTDNRNEGVIGHNTHTVIIGCDDSQICEGYAGDANLDFYLIGYITAGAVFNTNATNISLGTVDTWLDLAALPSGAVMGFIEVFNVPPTANLYGLRKNGSSEEIYRKGVYYPWAFVECDDNGVIEGKIEDLLIDFFVVGYAAGSLVITPSPAQTIGSVVAPTVIKGSVSITPDYAGSIAQVTQPTVKAGNIIYAPTPIDAIAKAVSPSVILGSLLLTPDFVSAIGDRVNPVVVLGSTSKTPTYIEAITGVVAPIVSVAGVLYITPAAIDAIGGRVNPTVVLGSIIITPDALFAIGEVVAPNAVQGNIIFGPAFAKALGEVVAPTVIGGDLILEPESIEAIARGENPEVILASMTITPEFIEAIAGVVAPYVLQTWIGRKLKLVILTSQYRKVNVTTCQNRKVNVATGQKRKVRVITGA